MGRGLDGSDAYAEGGDWESPEHPAQVDSFALDTFEVTVGRFRKFLDAFDGSPPPSEGGAHPAIPGSGWQSQWNEAFPKSKTDITAPLKKLAEMTYSNWSDSPDGREAQPIYGVTWYEAFAFCIWDGGRLPTEAEWEYTAAGGQENRRYPWGAVAPQDEEETLVTRPWESCIIPLLPPFCTPMVSEVGTRPLGAGKWGHLDLSGGVDEWVLDTAVASIHSAHAAAGGCSPCVSLDASPRRVIRSINGREQDIPFWTRSAARSSREPMERWYLPGIRCASDPFASAK